MDSEDVTSFLFEGESPIRVIYRNGDIWFVAADVCRALGIKNPRDTVGRLDDDERGVAFTDTPGGKQEMLVISEGGLSTLIMRSHSAMKPGTLPHRFRRWVTSEVLPKLRQTGQVCLERKAITPELDRLRLVRETLKTFGTRAAGEMWFHLGLPVVPAMILPPAQSDLLTRWVRPTDGTPPQSNV